MLRDFKIVSGLLTKSSKICEQNRPDILVQALLTYPENIGTVSKSIITTSKIGCARAHNLAIDFAINKIEWHLILCSSLEDVYIDYLCHLIQKCINLERKNALALRILCVLLLSSVFLSTGPLDFRK